MLWRGRRQSSNVDDRRGMGGPLAVGGGIIGVIALIFNFLLGDGDISSLPQQLPGAGGGAPTEQTAADNERAEFVKVVLADTEDTWNELFSRMGKNYPVPTLSLFNNSVQSGCGGASASSGPFYCPADRKVYIDLSFYQELQTRFNAPGDFAMAYVVAHEVGHHIQNVLGISDQMQNMRGRVSEERYNKQSVMLELQADFLAGVWAHYQNQKTHEGRDVLEEGDIEEALSAANAIGDDRLQKESQGYIVPESFTHGTSAQRMYWFKKGFQTGDINQGDTFSAPDLQ